MGLLGVVLPLVALLLNVGWVANLTSMHSSDPAGNALSQAYAAVMAVGLWVLLAALMLFAGLNGEMPRWAMALAWILVPASGAAALAAVQLLSDSFYQARWPLVVPVLAPLLLVGFALWAYLPSLHRAVPAPTASVVSWAAIAILSIVPWPAVRYRASHRTADQARAEAQRKADEPRRLEKERQQNLAAFRKLTPESELAEWLEFRSPGNELRQQALEAIRHLARRQADAEQMIQRRLDYFWDDLPEFDLAATPIICERARVFLRERAQDIQPKNPDQPPQFRYLIDRVEPYLVTMKWNIGAIAMPSWR